MSLFGAKIEPKILGTKNWTQNLRDQGLQFDSVEHKSTPKS